VTGDGQRPARPARTTGRPDPHAVVPAAEVRTYYDRPVLKAPVWKPEVPWYFFFGGLAGGSSMLAVGARAIGDRELARAARWAAALGAVASPVLLVADLGVPSRFLNILRVFRPTSPLNMGAWLLGAYAPPAVGAALLAEVGRLPRVQQVAELVAAATATGLTTYTAVLVADTAIPVWHDARRELPFVFAGSAGASAGAAALALTGGRAPAARNLALAGTALELTATAAMERRLGDLAQPYHDGRAGTFATLARGLAVAGAAVTLVAGRRRAGARLGAALLLGGAVCERWAVFRAGFQSAARPADTLGPQRARVEARQATT
jgi:hypothetical protein